MKKLFSFILAWVIVLSALPLSASAKTQDQKVAEKIGYEVYSYHWQNGTLYVQGCVTNRNKKHDILGLKDAVLVVTDSRGLELFYVQLNDTFEKNFILRPESKRPYNFSSKTLLHDPGEYSSLDSGLRVFFSSFSFGYSKCGGKNCGNCQGTGLDLDENPFEATSPNPSGSTLPSGQKKQSDPAPKKDKTCGICNNTKKCHVCSGKGSFYCDSLYCSKGLCTSCKGTGLYDHGSYVSKCLVCRGDGRCDICGGTTRRDCTICHGDGKCSNCI